MHYKQMVHPVHVEYPYSVIHDSVVLLDSNHELNMKSNIDHFRTQFFFLPYYHHFLVFGKFLGISIYICAIRSCSYGFMLLIHQTKQTCFFRIRFCELFIRSCICTQCVCIIKACVAMVIESFSGIEIGNYIHFSY